MPVQHSGRLAQQFRRLFGFKEQYAPNVAEEILPVINSTNPNNSEFFRHRDEELFGALGSVAAVAAQFAQVTFCPLRPGDIMTIEQLVITTFGGAGLTVIDAGFIQEVLGTTGNFSSPADTRGIRYPTYAATVNPTRVNVASGNPGAGTFNGANRIFTAQMAQGANLVIPLRVVCHIPSNITTGTNVWKFCVATNTANAGFAATILGWLRTFEPAEAF